LRKIEREVGEEKVRLKRGLKGNEIELREKCEKREIK